MGISRCLGCMGFRQGPVCGRCGFREGMKNPEDMLPLEKILRGQYLVGRLRSQNYFYAEYTALDLALDRPVILRELFPDGSSRNPDGSISPSELDVTGESLPHNRELFIREARALGAASQLPHVLTVYDLFTENNTEYLVTELRRDGSSLNRLLCSQGPMALEEAISLLEPVGMDLQRIWDGGLRPWELNCGSILCVPGSGWMLRDLGAASAWWDPDADMLVYSPFRAMEVRSSDHCPGPWDLVFSLCGVLCCCLLGQGDVICRDKRLEKRIPMLPVPESVKAVLARGMAPKAEDRIQSPAALFGQLRGVL